MQLPVSSNVKDAECEAVVSDSERPATKKMR